ncbi:MULTISPECIES: DinB family protein [Arthrobacter]|uniref:DinB family protein n=1 Tax=Arthrobacter TaxID=1663 RepID=UPI0006D9808D|nr:MULTISPECIES: DinB family protein [unclassified Arthrobacter]KPN19364.1 hypothetical protein AO716_06130 [Arthrobacter sp. Edens01]MSR98529.1 DinB family protein [Arthrobacter sp. BL-252-APC-1A]
MLTDNRIDPPDAAGERETLNGFLDYLRASAVYKAQGLSDADAARRVLPSLTTVSGLLRHLADVERSWFRERMDGQDGVPSRWSDEDPDGEFRVSESDSLAGIIADYEAACAESREVAARYALDDVARAETCPHNLRWILVHMVEETGRHCGHLDVVRELLDGVTGE